MSRVENIEREIEEFSAEELAQFRQWFAGFDTQRWEERLGQIRKQHPKAYNKWTGDDDKLLSHKFKEGAAVTELAKLFQRQPGAIRSRRARLGLI